MWKSNNNHTVPEVYLKQFLNKDWKFWVFDNQKIWRQEELCYRGISNLTVKRKFYVWKTKHAEEDYTIETDILANNIESAVKEPLLKISQRKILDEDDMSVLSYFVIFQYIRTTKFKSNFIDSRKAEQERDIIRNYSNPWYLEKVITKMKSKGKDVSWYNSQEMAAKVKSWDIKPSVTVSKEYYLNFMLHTVTRSVEDFFNMEWKLLVAPHGKYFITTDNPFIITPVWEKNIWIWIKTPWAKKYIPLSPDVCLELGDVWASWKIPSYITISEKELNKINYYLAVNYDRHIISNNKNTLESIIIEHRIKERRKEDSYLLQSSFSDHILLNFNILPK